MLWKVWICLHLWLLKMRTIYNGPNWQRIHYQHIDNNRVERKQRLPWPHSMCIESATGVCFIGYISMQCCVMLVKVQLAKCLRRHSASTDANRVHIVVHIVKVLFHLCWMCSCWPDRRWQSRPARTWLTPVHVSFENIHPSQEGSDHSCPRPEGTCNGRTQQVSLHLCNLTSPLFCAPFGKIT